MNIINHDFRNTSPADRAPMAHQQARIYIEKLVRDGGDVDRISALYANNTIAVTYDGRIMKNFALTQ